MEFRCEVTEEYLENAGKKNGKVFTQEGYDISLHGVEIEISKKIAELFGTDITLMKEKNCDKTMTPDALYKGRYWEIKYPTTEQAADSALRKGMKQIRENPGGVVLYYGNKAIDLKRLKGIISGRMRKIRNSKKEVDIVIVSESCNVKVLRYK